ncbi:MAG: amino acid--tRNA ligase-related protein [Lentisphaeria bacterium]
MNESKRLNNSQYHLHCLDNALSLRHRLYQSIRRFFADRNFLEVTTPVQVRTPALEDHVAIQTTDCGYLRPSPELHMKQLLAAGYDRIYQLGPCFRKNETGALHAPEFTMLEWYRSDCDYWDILTDTKALIQQTLRDTGNSSSLQCKGKMVNTADNWQLLTVDEAFEKYVGHTPEQSLGNERFEEDLLDKILPAIDQSRPLVLCDYPVQLGGLARSKPENPNRLERWELYIDGMEIANAYNELTNHKEQLERYRKTRERQMKAGEKAFPEDEDFFRASESGIPDSGGIAFGVDRWLMMLAGAEEIAQIQPFLKDF